MLLELLQGQGLLFRLYTRKIARDPIRWIHSWNMDRLNRTASSVKFT